MDVRHERALSRAGLSRSIYHRVGDGRGVSRSLRGADEPRPKERRRPGGVRGHLFPRMSSLSRDEAHAGDARASTMAYGFAAICAPALILSWTFFRYWIGADFAKFAAPVAQVLFPGMWMGALSLVGFTLLQSQGRADVTGKLNIVEFVPFVAILWVLTQSFGIVGAATAWSLRCTVDALAMLWLSGMRRRSFFLCCRRPLFWRRHWL